MKAISFALWGDSQKYLVGMAENIKLAKKLYPGWECIVYAFNQSAIRAAAGAKLVVCKTFGDYRNLFLRLEPCFNRKYERVIIRDCDSRINKREAAAVKAWERTDYPLHIIRDHPHHHIPIMGGLFGVAPAMMPGRLLGIDMSAIAAGLDPVAPTPLGNHWNSDQLWLEKNLWGEFKDNHLAHDPYRFFTGKELKLTTNLPSGQFCGQRWGHDNNPELEI